VKPLRIAVVGVGHMGRRHAEKVAALARAGIGVELVGVADIDPDCAGAVASALNTRAVRDGRELFPESDAAVVAVSTVSHFEVVRDALTAGLDVLVEKPIAATLEEAETLVELANRNGRLLQVGHQEWFNAAMRVVRERIDAPRFAEIHRLGMFSDRGTDVDVVRDLMIHDLEILQQLLGEEPERVDAVGIPVLTDHVDIANARLVFGNRCVANLTASRVSLTPMRKFRIFQRDAYFSIDFLEQKAALFRRHPPVDGGTPRIEMEEFKTDPEDSLRAQLEAFTVAVRRRPGEDGEARGSAGVSGAEAASALRTALRVIDAMPSIQDLP
jgi:predicted dehydrogenase